MGTEFDKVLELITKNKKRIVLLKMGEEAETMAKSTMQPYWEGRRDSLRFVENLYFRGFPFGMTHPQNSSLDKAVLDVLSLPNIRRLLNEPSVDELDHLEARLRLVGGSSAVSAEGALRKLGATITKILADVDEARRPTLI